MPKILLPIGISFFTFQAVSYVIDVYRGDGIAQRDPLNVALYISFFPQLIAGPIVRYQTISDQINNRKETFDDFSYGVCRFICGFAKKILLANTLAVVADTAFKQNVSSTGLSTVALAWLGVVAYGFQILFDFSGYSDMAIGMGRMFGFHFLENFNYPYISKSITEFWRRWHISLGTWFRDYVYFPMGGSRVAGKGRLVFNLFIVWLLTGIWHGANWTFFVWGLMYFALLAFEKLTGFYKKLGWLGHVYTLFFVLVGWVVFRAENLAFALRYLQSMFGLDGSGLFDVQALLLLRENGVFLIAAIICSVPLGAKLGALAKDKKLILVIYPIFLFTILILSLAYLVKGSYNPFIYFNF